MPEPEDQEEEEEPRCPRCGGPDGYASEDACPLAKEIYDRIKLCRCCNECRYECKLSI